MDRALLRPGHSLADRTGRAGLGSGPGGTARRRARRRRGAPGPRRPRAPVRLRQLRPHRRPGRSPGEPRDVHARDLPRPVRRLSRHRRGHRLRARRRLRTLAGGPRRGGHRLGPRAPVRPGPPPGGCHGPSDAARGSPPRGRGHPHARPARRRPGQAQPARERDGRHRQHRHRRGRGWPPARSGRPGGASGGLQPVPRRVGPLPQPAPRAGRRPGPRLGGQMRPGRRRGPDPRLPDRQARLGRADARDRARRRSGRQRRPGHRPGPHRRRQPGRVGRRLRRGRDLARPRRPGRRPAPRDPHGGLGGLRTAHPQDRREGRPGDRLHPPDRALGHPRGRHDPHHRRTRHRRRRGQRRPLGGDGRGRAGERGDPLRPPRGLGRQARAGARRPVQRHVPRPLPVGPALRLATARLAQARLRGPHRRRCHLRRRAGAGGGRRARPAPAIRGIPLRRLQARDRRADPAGHRHRPGARRARRRHPAHRHDRGRAGRRPPLVGEPRRAPPGHLRRPAPRRRRPVRRRGVGRPRGRRLLPGRLVGARGRTLRHARRRGVHRHAPHGVPRGRDELAGQAAPRRDARHRGGHVGAARRGPRRHDLGPVPAARRHLRGRQRQRRVLPPPGRGRLRRARHRRAPRRDRRGAQPHRQALLRRHRGDDLPPDARAVRRTRLPVGGRVHRPALRRTARPGRGAPVRGRPRRLAERLRRAGRRSRRGHREARRRLPEGRHPLRHARRRRLLRGPDAQIPQAGAVRPRHRRGHLAPLGLGHAVAVARSPLRGRRRAHHPRPRLGRLGQAARRARRGDPLPLRGGGRQTPGRGDARVQPHRRDGRRLPRLRAVHRLARAPHRQPGPNRRGPAGERRRRMGDRRPLRLDLGRDRRPGARRHRDPHPPDRPRRRRDRSLPDRRRRPPGSRHARAPGGHRRGGGLLDRRHPHRIPARRRRELHLPLRRRRRLGPRPSVRAGRHGHRRGRPQLALRLVLADDLRRDRGREAQRVPGRRRPVPGRPPRPQRASARARRGTGRAADRRVPRHGRLRHRRGPGDRHRDPGRGRLWPRGRLLRRPLRHARPHRGGGPGRPGAARRRRGRRGDPQVPPGHRDGDGTDEHDRLRDGLRRLQPDPHLARGRRLRRRRGADRPRHVAVRRRRIPHPVHRRHPDPRLDLPHVRHRPPRGEDRGARREGRARARRRAGPGGHVHRRRGRGRHGERCRRRAVHRLPVPGPGDPGPGHGPRRARGLARRPPDVGAGRRPHPREARLLDPGGRARQSARARRQRRALPPPRRPAQPHPVHPGRPGDRRRGADRAPGRRGRPGQGRAVRRPFARGVHGAVGLRRGLPPGSRPGDRLPARLDHAQPRPARRRGTLRLPPRGAAPQPVRRARRGRLRRVDLRADGRVPGSRQPQPGGPAVRRGRDRRGP